MTGAIPVLRLGRTLLASIQIDLSDAIAEALQNDILAQLERVRTTGLVVDISGFDTVDTYAARLLAETAGMAKLMGCDTVLVGMRPEVAATLARMGYAMADVKFALNVEEGLTLLGHIIPK